jgi:hypothetical protein
MKELAIAVLMLSALGLARAGEPSLHDCQPIGRDFRIGPYLTVAKELQQLGQERAVAKLREWARSRKSEDQVIILARMLFAKRAGGELRRPMIGEAMFLGGTGDSAWPLEPIALHRNVPILVTTGYALAGKAEPSVGYLEECVKNGGWRAVKYSEVDRSGLEEILADFIETTWWRKALTVDEEAFLRKQAGPNSRREAPGARDRQ